MAGLLAERGIKAPLMVVKGDGSLIEAAVAMACPVETILSGPAASVVGAHHLSGEKDVFVSDMGGTTTDIALLSGGRPVLNRDGATVGGFRTMVEAVGVHTFGLGGDSEARLNEDGLIVGPRRVMPLSLLGHQHPAEPGDPAPASRERRSGSPSRPIRASPAPAGCRRSQPQSQPDHDLVEARRGAAAAGPVSSTAPGRSARWGGWSTAASS